jgi:multiple sugar transport system permease protein
MLTNRRKDARIAAVLVAPFLAIYLLVFVWPTIQMLIISFTDAPLIGRGDWVGLENYGRLDSDARFRTAVWNTA